MPALLLLTTLALTGGIVAALAQTGGSRAAPPSGSDPGAAAGVYTALAAIFLLTCVNALLSIAESALHTARRVRIEQMQDEGQRGASSVLALLEQPNRFLAATKVGGTLCRFAVAAVAATSLAPPLGLWLYRLNLLPPTGAVYLAIVLLVLLTALFLLVFGEIVPKALTVRKSELWALRLAPLIRLVAVLLAPLSALAVGISNLIVRPLGATAQFEAPVITEEELKQIIEASEETGQLDDDEREMLHNVFDLGETPVRAVMTPRTDMTSLAVETPLDEVREAILRSGHSRIPIYEDTVDRIVGILHAKDLLPLLGQELSGFDLREVIRPAQFVAETKRVSELLNEFRHAKNQLAIVQDEYAGTEGIVTIEDLLEEIVGDIRDEYDVDEPEIQVLSPTESLMDGRMKMDDVGDRLGLEFPRGDFDTISGFLFGELGREPHVGDRVRFENYEFVVEQVDNLRARTVRAIQLPVENENTSAEKTEIGVVPAAENPASAADQPGDPIGDQISPSSRR